MRLGQILSRGRAVERSAIRSRCGRFLNPAFKTFPLLCVRIIPCACCVLRVCACGVVRRLSYRRGGC